MSGFLIFLLVIWLLSSSSSSSRRRRNRRRGAYRPTGWDINDGRPINMGRGPIVRPANTLETPRNTVTPPRNPDTAGPGDPPRPE